MRTLIGFKRVVFAAVAAMGVAAFGEGEEPADIRARMWFYGNPPKGCGATSPGEYNAYSFVNGVINQASFYDCTVLTYTFDMGSQKNLTRMRVVPAQQTDYWRGRSKNLKFSVSSNAVDWVCWLDTGSTGMVNIGWNEYKLPDEWKDCKFRYARISNSDKYAGCGEMEFYTTDMSVTIGVPDNWSDRGVKAMDVESEKGVRIFGKVYRPTEAPVKVYAYVSRQDYDDDLAAWRKNGQEFLLGEDLAATSAGVNYSGYVTGLKKGYWFVRTFAVCGDEVAASFKTQYFVSHSEPATTVKAYVNVPEKDNGGKVRNPGIWVDGKQGGRVEYPNNTGIWTIFDLQDYTASNKYVTAVRLLCANDCPQRRTGAVVEYAYDDPENPAVWTTQTNYLETATRTLSYVKTEDLPSQLEWLTAGNFSDYDYDQGYAIGNLNEAAIFPSSNATILKTYRRQGKLPRYLRVRGILANDITEIELRLSKIPSEGLAISVR